MNIAAMPDTIISRANYSSAGNRSIGALLIDSGRLTPEAAERVLKLQKEEGIRFGDAAMKLGLINEDDIRFALSRQFDYPYLTPDDDSVAREVVAAFNPFAAAVEHLRALRSQLMLRLFEADPSHSADQRSLAIVSPDQGEGRSWLAANLAVVFSQLGERTLLIDADLRNPCQHRLFRLNNQAGLSAILAGRADPGECIQRVQSLVGLSVLPAGVVPPNPHELLGRPAFSNLLDGVRERFDIVLIDTPAGKRSADATTIASRAGTALAVGRRHITATHRLLAQVDSLRQAGTPVVGVVLNAF